MKYSHIYSFNCIFINIFITAQIGINTALPQAAFHIDGLSDNNLTELPTSLQQQNDFVITSDGNIGIGTIQPRGKLEINSISSTFIPPRLTTLQRDSILTGSRPTGSMIYNTSLNSLQINTGTDLLPNWTTLQTVNETLNTTITFTKTDGEQIIPLTNSIITFDTTPIFNSTPTGYVHMQNNGHIILTKGKTYRLEVNMGRLESSDIRSTWCYIRNMNETSITSVSISPTTQTSNWNSSNTLYTFINRDNSTTDAVVYISCQKTNSGTSIVNKGIAPILSITIMN